MGRSPCCDELAGLKKGPWTQEEDDMLTSYIKKNGHGSWRALPKLAGLNRCGKSCRLRWTNYLRPDIKRGRFTDEEEDMIIKLHSVLGNKWSRIATHLPGRTDNEIKNHWNTHLRKKLLRMGIDPVTHKPRTDHHYLLANLSQLINTMPNPLLTNQQQANLVYPQLDFNALRLQSDATAHLAKLQVLQNIFHILNTTTPTSSNTTTTPTTTTSLVDHPHSSVLSMLGFQSANSIDLIKDLTVGTTQSNNSSSPMNYPSPLVHSSSDQQNNLPLPSPSGFEDYLLGGFMNTSSSSSGPGAISCPFQGNKQQITSSTASLGGGGLIAHENALPGLVSVPTTNEASSTVINDPESTHSLNDYLLDGWEKFFVDDGITSDFQWQDWLS